MFIVLNPSWIMGAVAGSSMRTEQRSTDVMAWKAVGVDEIATLVYLLNRKRPNISRSNANSMYMIEVYT